MSSCTPTADHGAGVGCKLRIAGVGYAPTHGYTPAYPSPQPPQTPIPPTSARQLISRHPTLPRRTTSPAARPRRTDSTAARLRAIADIMDCRYIGYHPHPPHRHGAHLQPRRRSTRHNPRRRSTPIGRVSVLLAVAHQRRRVSGCRGPQLRRLVSLSRSSSRSHVLRRVAFLACCGGDGCAHRHRLGTRSTRSLAEFAINLRYNHARRRVRLNP